MTARLGSLATRRLVAVGGLAALILGAALFHEITDDSSNAPDQASPLPASSGPNAPPDGLPQEGPGVTEPGVLVAAEPMPDGSLAVREWVVRSTASASIALEVPDLLPAGNNFAELSPSVTQVRISGPNGEIPLTSDTLNDSVVLPVPEPTKAYELTYELDDATVVSEPSSRGRALAALVPVSSGASDELPVVFATTSSAVRTFACPASAAPLEPCTEGTPPFLQTDVALSGGEAVVVIQFDIPS